MSLARRKRQLVVAVLGAFLALVAIAAPRTARASTAASVELCDPDVFASMIPMAELATMRMLAQLGETDLVGFCDVRGATSIAPLPARPLDGSVIDGASGEAPSIRDGVNVGSRQSDPTHRSLDSSPIDQAWSGSALLFPRRAKAQRVPVVATRLDLPAGFGRRVDHPPRR